MLVRQLRPGGRMVVPVGQAHGRQTLTLLVKSLAGRVMIESVLPVAFVPMVKGHETTKGTLSND